MLDAISEQRLLDLARHRQLVIEQEMADDLLGDRRRAERPLTALKAQDVRHCGAEDGCRVDALVVVKVTILGGQDCLDHQPRNFGDRHRDAVLTLEFGHQSAVRGVDLAAGRWHVIAKLLIIR